MTATLHAPENHLKEQPAANTRIDPVVVMHARVVTGAGGGPEKTILNSCRYYPPAGYLGVCGYLHPPQDPGFAKLQQRAADRGAVLLSIPDRGATDLSVIRRTLQLCREHRVTIWHGHDYKSNLLGLLIARFHPLRLVTTLHGWVQQTARTKLFFLLDRWSLKYYERIFCVSTDLYDQAVSLKLPLQKLVLLENGIESQSFRRELTPRTGREQLGLPPDLPLIGAVGRLSYEKGFDQLIAAVTSLHQAGHAVQLAIAGEGPEQAALETCIAQQPHPDRFRLLGHQSDTRAVYHAMDIFALSSRREGLPNVVLEAMSMSTPVVATEIAGVPRVITHNETGLLVPPERSDLLADALTRLVTEPQFAEQLAQRGRECIVSRFDFATRMQGEIDVYHDLLNRPAGR